jgi:hypothetical protein
MCPSGANPTLEVPVREHIDGSGFFCEHDRMAKVIRKHITPHAQCRCRLSCGNDGWHWREGAVEMVVNQEG